MKRAVLILTALILSACVEKTINSQQAFFENLSSLCGQTFTGYSTYPGDPGHDFAGKLLKAHFSSCDNQQIKIKFDVGADRSRTWLVSRSQAGLLLKHDHRHKDGTPDEITNYGGWADNQGTVWRQHFVADAETAELIPAAATNVWMLQYDPGTKVLTYDLKRHNKPRYQAQLKPKQ